MFTDRDASSMTDTGFASNWKRTLAVTAASCQTDDIAFSETNTQTVSTQDSAVQTEPKEIKPVSGDPTDDPALLRFLQSAVPVLEAELEAAIRSRAFDGYVFSVDEPDRTVQKVHTLTVGTTSPSRGATREEDELRVCDVAWNATGTFVAVAFERGSHDNWCDHETALALWNINRRDFDPGDPLQQMSASSCLTAVRFHPKDSALVVAGGYTGELFLWQVSKEGILATSGLNGHRERITCIEWRVDSSSADNTLKTSKILTSSLDGRIIQWTIDHSGHAMTAERIFVLAAEHLPRALRLRARSDADVAITCMAINTEDRDIVLLGTESGVIFQGSLSSELPATIVSNDASGADIPYLDPVSLVFAAHRGRVVSVACSPFLRDAFLSAGSDKELRLYSLLQPHAPVHVIQMDATNLCWSPTRPAVFAAASGSTLCLFDLRKNANAGRLGLKGFEKGNSAALTAMAFNRRDNNLVAAGDEAGNVHVWKLTEEFSSANPAEVKWLEAFLNSAMDAKLN
jgi:WD40 repeat protein